MTTYRIGDIRPNPFRNIDRYPINRDKVEKLKESIGRTDFWDNLVARIGADGQPEIGYGHHRMVALRELFDDDHEISLIIRDLDDAAMLHVMADENMQEWVASGAVIIETVRAVRDFLAGAAEKVSTGGRPPENGSIADVTTFLGWPAHRVEEALSIIRAEEASLLEPEDTADLPLAQATALRLAVSAPIYKANPVLRAQTIAKVREEVKRPDRERIGYRSISDVARQVREEVAPSPVKPVVALNVALELYREVDQFFRRGIPVGWTTKERRAVIQEIAENREAIELRGTSGPMADQIADALDEMASQATELASLLRHGLMLEAGVTA